MPFERCETRSPRLKTASMRLERITGLKQLEPKWKKAGQRITQLEATLKDKDRAYEKLRQKQIATEKERARLEEQLKEKVSGTASDRGGAGSGNDSIVKDMANIKLDK